MDEENKLEPIFMPMANKNNWGAGQDELFKKCGYVAFFVEDTKNIVQSLPHVNAKITADDFTKTLLDSILINPSASRDFGEKLIELMRERLENDK